MRVSPSGSTTPVVAAWVLTRVGLVVTALAGWYPQQSPVTGDVRIYEHWARDLLEGRFPLLDRRWQYPPGAALPILGGTLTGHHYEDCFVGLMLAVDLTGLVLLLRRAPRRTAGAWVWTLGLAALGPVTWLRFDLVPTVLAVAAITVAGAAGGALLAVGGWVKVWPLLVVPVLRRTTAAAWGLLAAGVVGVAALALAGQLSTLTVLAHHETGRGLQIESVLAAGYLIGDLAGHPTVPRYHYGSFQVAGPHVAGLLRLSDALLAAVIVGYLAAAVAWRRAGAPPVSLALAGLLGVIVTSRVLSAQYLVWPLGLAAVAVALGERRQLVTAGLLGCAAALTQVIYPATYADLLAGRPGAAGVLLARDALLLAALLSAASGAASSNRSPSETRNLTSWAPGILAQ